MLEVVCGPVFASKTTYLIDKGRWATATKQAYFAFRIQKDTRYDRSDVQLVSHNQVGLPAIKIEHSTAILEKVTEDRSLVLIDEAQFFDTSLSTVIEHLILKNHNVVVAGLDLDANGRPFGPMSGLLSIADKVTKLTANCSLCSELGTATRSIYKGPIKTLENARDISENVVHIGGAEIYEPRCFPHWAEFMQINL